MRSHEEQNEVNAEAASQESNVLQSIIYKKKIIRGKLFV